MMVHPPSSLLLQTSSPSPSSYYVCAHRERRNSHTHKAGRVTVLTVTNRKTNLDGDLLPPPPPPRPIVIYDRDMMMCTDTIERDVTPSFAVTTYFLCAFPSHHPLVVDWRLFFFLLCLLLYLGLCCCVLLNPVQKPYPYCGCLASRVNSCTSRSLVNPPYQVCYYYVRIGPTYRTSHKSEEVPVLSFESSIVKFVTVNANAKGVCVCLCLSPSQSPSTNSNYCHGHVRRPDWQWLVIWYFMG